MVKKRLGCEVKQAWGMSELSPLGTSNSDFSIKSASIGPLLPSTHGKVIDENGNSLGPNESGELCIKGPQVMMGYLDDPDKTAECLSKSGWLRTGDVASYDEDGYFFIKDRIKELIKVRGFQVAPAELEELLLTNDLVNDVAVIQVPDEESGELPRAYVVLRETPGDEEATKTSIYEWAKEKVVPYKRLDGGIIFTDVIPKSASGKILRRLLRDQVKEEFAAKLE
jgi:acyl-CoA synthetase (AMP-forming)/AMP-acid ligase II